MIVAAVARVGQLDLTLSFEVIRKQRFLRTSSSFGAFLAGFLAACLAGCFLACLALAGAFARPLFLGGIARGGSPGSPQTILGEYRASPGEGLPDTRRRRYAPHEEKPGIPTPRAPSDRIRQPLFIITPGAYVIRYPDSSSTKKKPRPPKIARFLSPSVMELPPKP